MSEKNTALAIVPQQPPTGLQIQSMTDLGNLGKMLAASGYFKDAREAAQACVKVQAGLEIGIPPVQAMTGIHIIEGKPTFSAAIMSTLIKRSGRYNYRVTKHSDEECVIDFYEGKEKVGTSSFTVKDAETAGLLRKGPWQSFRRNMLFARAISNGARWYCPDIFGGPAYTPEELGVDVDGDGAPIAAAPPEKQAAPPATAQRLSAALTWAREHMAKVAKAAHVNTDSDDERKAAEDAVQAARASDERACKALDELDHRLFLAVRAHDDQAQAAVLGVAYELNDEERAAVEWFKAQA